ncbi:hypothetical protein WJX73_008959 [Symbiochloris irregularis]|uniref:Protein kinase domain-containing protein n=1 Tax=Symbiochloris irregularis TaxID=706552 RepID=A0AAW1PPU4_9CHLO
MRPQEGTSRPERLAASAGAVIVAAAVSLLIVPCRSEATASQSGTIGQQSYNARNVSELFAVMQNNQASYNVTVAADLHLTNLDWPSTVRLAPGSTVYLIGDGDKPGSTIFDFGNLVNAIQVPSGATFGNQNLLVTGLSWPARGSQEISNLPECQDCLPYPSVIAYPNSTLVDYNVGYEIEPSYFHVNCSTWTENFMTNVKDLPGYTTNQSSDGLNLTLASATPEPAIDHGFAVSGNVSGGAAALTLVLIGSETTYCYETMEARPNTYSPQIHIDQLASNSTGSGSTASQSSSGSGKLSGGGIAGIVVGSVVGAALLAILGFFILRRFASPQAEKQKALDAGLLGTGGSTTNTTNTNSDESKGRQSPPDVVPHQWQLASPPMQLQAAAQRSGISACTSNWGDGSSVGQLEGSPTHNVEVDRCTMQFDWHIQPNRLVVRGGAEARPIGQGAYGVVYEGILDGFKPVAIKFLHPGNRPIHLSTRARFMGEVDLLRACRDKNVVDFKGAWVQQDPDLVYMVTELMETDLMRAIAEDQASASGSTPGIGSTPAVSRQLGWYGRGPSIALDVLQGLHYLHANNVIHLDIKSANILLARDGTAKIADVGLARTLSQSALRDHHREGTLAWQSPEMILGEPASFSADMWSFGVILLEVVNAQMPERGHYSTPIVPEQCPQDIADLIQKCMLPDPTKRPSTLEAIRIVAPYTDRGELLTSGSNLISQTTSPTVTTTASTKPDTSKTEATLTTSSE